MYRRTPPTFFKLITFLFSEPKGKVCFQYTIVLKRETVNCKSIDAFATFGTNWLLKDSIRAEPFYSILIRLNLVSKKICRVKTGGAVPTLSSKKSFQENS